MSSNRNVLLSVDEILGLVTSDGGNDDGDANGEGEIENPMNVSRRSSLHDPSFRTQVAEKDPATSQMNAVRKESGVSFSTPTLRPPITAAKTAAIHKALQATSLPSTIPPKPLLSSHQSDLLSARPKTAAKKASRFELFEESNKQILSSSKTTATKRSSNSRFDIFENKLREEEDINGIILWGDKKQMECYFDTTDRQYVSFNLRYSIAVLASV